MVSTIEGFALSSKPLSFCSQAFGLTLCTAVLADWWNGLDVILCSNCRHLPRFIQLIFFVIGKRKVRQVLLSFEQSELLYLLRRAYRIRSSVELF